jgi:purine/pyrimidine-nucleoside phosphorylase
VTPWAAPMSPAEYSNVTAVAKANVYFDGKVTSHTIKFADGSKKTLGLIYAGEFHFGTDAPERMDIIAGACDVRLDGESEWKTYEGGSFFQVPGKSGFDIKVAAGIAEYVCSFE